MGHTTRDDVTEACIEGLEDAKKLITLDASTANINNTESYDSGWILCSTYERIRVNVNSDVSLDFHIEFSNDGANTYASSDTYSNTAGSGRGDGWATFDKYVKLIVKNNSGADTTTVNISLNGVK